MPCFSNPINANLQPLCSVYITDKIDKNPLDQEFITNLIKNNYTALIDTGANHSCITDRLANKLSLKALQKKRIVNTSGVTESNVYAITLYIPIASNKIRQTQTHQSIDIKAFSNIKVHEIKYNSNNLFDVIIGMDIILQGQLTIAGNILHFAI